MAVVAPLTVLVLRAANSEDQSKPTLRPAMVVLPAGEFNMGSAESEANRDTDELQHRVSITRPFAISQTEVTQGQYQLATGKTAISDCSDGIDVGTGGNLPVVCVSWFDAVEYANAMSRIEGLTEVYEINYSDVNWKKEANGYRLPTEAEWEYAARAGTSTTFVGTDSENAVCEFANVADRTASLKHSDWNSFACDDSHVYLSPVENRRFNAWWLYGFGGNALEWVWDWYGDYDTNDATDPSGPVDGQFRVIRGGSFNFGPRNARVANRGWYVPGARNGSLGFRLSRSCYSSLLPSSPLQDCLKK
ncbi:hypothetical protein AB833_26760 [Chromatiales bacterium (ex Bugula neritina AB1)]|nr:hypothetical protein AB833_26760 [Chromatiales bacterium (ex Bugula neritina AB1)]